MPDESSDLPAVPPKNTEIVPRKPPKPLDLTVREGLFRLAVLFDREVNEAWEPLWLENLADVDPPLLELAFQQLMKTFIPSMACPFPAPTHVWDILKELEETTDRNESEDSWQEAIKAVDRNYYPDLGRSPKFTPRSEYAVRAAGGIHYLANATREQLVWAKKAFREAYLLHARIEQYSQPGGFLSPELRPLLRKTMKKFREKHG